MFLEAVFDFLGIYIFATSDDHIRFSSRQIHKALLILPTEVTRVQPAIPDFFGSSLRVLPVSLKNNFPPHNNFPYFCWPESITIFINHPELMPTPDLANGFRAFSPIFANVVNIGTRQFCLAIAIV